MFWGANTKASRGRTDGAAAQMQGGAGPATPPQPSLPGTGTTTAKELEAKRKAGRPASGTKVPKTQGEENPG